MDPDSRTTHYHLYRRSRTPIWLAMSWRALLALALIGIALAVHWFDRDGLRQSSGEPITFADVLYFTMITVTTVGYDDIVPVTQQARLFDTFVVTPIRLFVWLIFLGTAYEFLLKRVWGRWRMSVIQRHLTDHVVIAGFGNSGSEAAIELIRRGADPDTIVVVDDNAGALHSAEALGVTVMEGNATRNAALEAVRVSTARALIVAAGRDDTSILIVLTARRIAPMLPISVVVRSRDNEAIARQAGANTVINPASFARLLLAGSTHGAHHADYMADLAATHGRVALRERDVTPEEVGIPLRAITTGLGHRVYRGDRMIGFWEAEANSLETGDVILEVVPAGERGSIAPL